MNENVVEDYGWSRSAEPHSCGYIAPEVVSTLKHLRVHRVLDLGAGNGALCGQLAAAGHEVVGVEYDKNGVEAARLAHPKITFYNFGVQDDPGGLLRTEEAFDAVVSTEVIEHLFSPHLLAIYANRVLKPAGVLVITTPYHGYFKNLMLSILDKWDHHHAPLWHGGHIKFWSRATLTRLLEENGFRVVAFNGIGRLPYLWKSMLLVARKNS